MNIWLGFILICLIFHEHIPSRILARLTPPTSLTNTYITTQPDRLNRFTNNLQEKNSFIIVAFGDSVTRGASVAGLLDPESVYHNQLKRLLEKRFPDVTFSVINSGVGGDEVSDGLARLDKSVIRFSPDLVLVEFGLNDSVNNGLAGLSKFRLTLTEIIRRIKQQTDAEIILLTPNFLATSDNVNVQNEHRQKGWAQKFPRIQNHGIHGQYAQAIRDVGIENDVPVADIYAEWKRLSDFMDTNTLLVNGLNHPDARGHRIAAETVITVIDPEHICDQPYNQTTAKGN